MLRVVRASPAGFTPSEFRQLIGDEKQVLMCIGHDVPMAVIRRAVVRVSNGMFASAVEHMAEFQSLFDQRNASAVKLLGQLE